MDINGKLKKHKLLVKNILSLSTLNALNVLLPLISIPYILRIVGVANYGKYSYVYVLIQYLLLITLYGFNYSATKQISQNRDNPERIQEIYNSVIACRIILFLAGLVLVMLFKPFILESKAEQLMFVLGIGMVLGDIFTPVWLFQGLEKMAFVTVINVISKTISTLLIFFIIRSPEDYVYIILFNSSGYIISGILSVYILRQKYNLSFSIPLWDGIVFQFKDGFTLFSSAVGINLYNNANVFILKFFVNDYALGIYAAAEKTIKGLKLLSSPISQALFPHLGYKFRDQPIVESLKQLKRAAIPFTVLLVVISVCTLIFSKTLIRIVGGKDFIESDILICIMSSTILLGGLNSLLGVSGLVNLNRQKDFLMGVFLAGISCIIFLLVFVPINGISAAAWATVLSELILLGWILISFYKIIKSNEDK